MSTAHDKGPEVDFDGIKERHGQRPPVYFMVLFLGLIVWGVIFMAYYLLSGWSSEQEFKEKMASHQQRIASVAQTPATAADTAPEVQPAAAAELFAAHCAACHGAAGKGGIGPDLTADTYKFGRSPAEVKASIAGGRPGGMPGFANQLAPAQITALATHVLSLK